MATLNRHIGTSLDYGFAGGMYFITGGLVLIYLAIEGMLKK